MKRLLVLVFVVFLCSCNRPQVSDVSDEEPYKDLIKKSFYLLEDCYVFQFLNESSGLPFVSPPSGGEVFNNINLPRPVDERVVRKEVDGLNVSGIIPAFHEFKVVSVKREKTIESSQIVIELEFVAPAIREKWPRINGLWLTVRNFDTMPISVVFDGRVVSSIPR